MKKQYKINKDIVPELLYEAVRMSYRMNIDMLKNSIRRELTDRGLVETVKDILEGSFHITMIHRDQGRIAGEPPYYEICLSTMGGHPEYFVWLNMSVMNGEKLISKFNLS
jgi:hypothetical protein